MMIQKTRSTKENINFNDFEKDWNGNHWKIGDKTNRQKVITKDADAGPEL